MQAQGIDKAAAGRTDDKLFAAYTHEDIYAEVLEHVALERGDLGRLIEIFAGENVCQIIHMSLV